MLQAHLSRDPSNTLFNNSIDPNIIILTISSLSGNTNWTFNGNVAGWANKIIMMSPLAEAGTTTSASGTAPAGVTSFSLSSTGNHTGSSAQFAGYPDSGTTPSYPQKLVNNSTGAHSHTMTGGSGLSNIYPPYMNVGVYQSNGTVYTLPANTIIFMDNQPSPDLMLISTKSANYENIHLRVSATEASINTSGGASTYTSSYTSTTAGAHDHSTYVSNGNYNTGVSTTRSNAGSVGDHTHSAVLSFTLDTYGMRLRTWITTCSTNLAPGMMMLLGSNSTVPTNWSLCNGSTIVGASGRTYITPNLNTSTYYLKSTSTTNHLVISGAGNTLTSANSSLPLTSWSHSHAISTSTTTYYRGQYHGLFDASHTHTFTAPNGFYNPPDVHFPMIMYTP